MNATLAAYLDRLPPPAPADAAAWVGSGASADPFLQQLRDIGLPWRCAALLGTHLLATGLLLASWACVGVGALSGRIDFGWLAAWALALASTVPLRVASRWLEGTIAVAFGGLLKQRLLGGAMAIDAEFVRGKGAGELLSEVLEAEAIDSLGASGGLQTLLAALELLLAVAVLAWAAGSLLQAAVLVGWTALLLALIARNTRLRRDWTALRLRLTNQLVENMVAHRTRLAQQPPSEWHVDEDRDAALYLASSARFDRSTVRIEAALPRGYVVAAIVAMTPAFMAGSATLAQLAITLGTILFAAAALERISYGFSRAAAGWVAWRCVQPIFAAAAPAQAPAPGCQAPVTASQLLQARSVVFTHHGRAEPVLRACSLTVEHGDQILLQGNSGSGKSTLAAILAGARQPSSGFILCGGLDRHTLGDAAWRSRIAMAPQYHENHILSASLGFNLLLSRPYPHSPQDLAEARAVCLELGLGELLERMPGGLDQFVGETGWRLSQGERSRVFLARALLQNAELVILDESMAALDPENLRLCLECVMRRANTLMVIAHP
jgi:ATP-binding cassette subfamily B protein